MITRITRGTVHKHAEARVFEVLRQAVDGTGAPPGLLSFSLSRRVKDSSAVELVAVSVWQDMESMAAVLGPGWREPSWMNGLGDSIADASVEILEGIVFGYEDLPTLALSTSG
jgi:heme-degrading monooxygenase HmoA